MPTSWLNGRRWEDEIDPPDAAGDGNPYAGEPIYSDADMDEHEEPRPEAVAREAARIAALRARRQPAVAR